MNYGMYVSASGALASMHRQDVLASNLANMDTAGFKPDRAFTMQRLPARIEDNLHAPSDRLLERLGGGLLSAPTRTSFEQGPITPTGDPLHVAIEGDGFILASDQRDGTERLRLTRDGRLSISADGRLVMLTTGMSVLDDRGRPIRMLADAPARIDADGAIVQEGREVGRLGLASVPTGGLRKLGDGLFEASTEVIDARTPASGRLRVGHLEGSAVDEIRSMIDIQSAANAVGSNVGMIQYHDRLMDRAINALGRVA